MEFKFKKDAEPQGSSDGFWYDLAYGGYINLGAVLEDEDQMKELNDAIDIVSSFETQLSNNDLLNEF